MNLFLSIWSYAGGGQRHLKTLLDYIPGKVVFTRMGHRGCLFHWLLRRHVVEDLCYRFQEADYPQAIAAYIDANAVTRLIVDNDERIPDVRRYSRRLQNGDCKVAFIVHTECGGTGPIEAAEPWKVVCVSQKIRESIKAINPVVIPNGVDRPPTTDFNVREFMGIPDDAFVVGYIGRIDPNKNIGAILDMARRTPWWVLLVGKGVLAVPPEMESRVRIFPTEVINVGDWYKAMNVFVLPSHSEGFPLAPMEALLSGTRVAMTPVSDFPVRFRNAVSFFEPGGLKQMHDAILAAPTPELGEEIILANYTGAGMAENYRRLLAW